MKLAKPTQYFHEYLFQQIIQNINHDLDNSEDIITTSRARELHKQFLDALPDHSMEAPTKEFLEAAKQVFGDGPDAPDLTLYREYMSEFSKMTGLAKKSDKNHTYAENPVLPLSPYDERFSDKSVFMENGSNLLYAMGSDIDSLGEVYDENMPVFTMTERGALKEAGNAMSLDDYSGMARLMPYLSQSDYNSVRTWVNKIGEKDKSKYMSPEAVTKSCEILKAMQEDGTTYNISIDSNAGQIKANLIGTRISVRLTDSRENEKYIGRIYDNGLSIYYTTNKKDFNSNHTLSYDGSSAKDCIRLLRFAQGKSIDRNDSNEPAGKVKSYSRGYYVGARNGQPRKEVLFNEAYHPKKNYSAVIGNYPGDPRSKVLIHVDSSRSNTSKYYRDDIAAETYLRDAVISARESFISSLDVNRLVLEAKEHYGEEDYFPDFSGDAGIAAIQKNYFEVLMGRQNLVFKPGKDNDEYKDVISNINNSEFINPLYDAMVADITYDSSLSPEEKIRQHALDSVDYFIGNYDLDADGKRFDPVMVASCMASEAGRYRNNDDIVAALRKINLNPDELKGSDFYNKTVKDRLIKFDKASAKPMASIANSYVQNLFQEIKTTINETGCIVNDRDILLDDNGIVRYTASRAVTEKVKADGSSLVSFTGEIGQIFVPDDLGLVETKFAGSDNHLFAPGYEAYVVPQKHGENKTLEERTRLKGLEQVMRDSVRYQIRSDMMNDSLEVGSPTSINNAYRRLYDTRYPLDYLIQSKLDGKSDDLLYDTIKTESRRVKYSNELRDNSTINAAYQASIESDTRDIANDNYQDYYNLTGRRNMSVMSEEGDGYFDASATATSVNQGITRYLTESAIVNSDGTITRGDIDDKTPLMKNEVCKYMDFIPEDRRQMTFSNLQQASCVASGVHTAQMTFGGWTFDDGYVVSKNFADTYKIRGSNGERRSLVVGDKISDMNGNKGVISLVVDPDMDLEEAEAKGIKTAVEWFKANKGNLDVVGAPFPAPSRFNGGSARELMENPSDLIAPDGTVHKGCVGTTHYIITHMAVDEKTHIYGEDELAKGKGRKASAQLAWALASQDATEVLKECYASNNSTLSNLRELMITTGLDLDETGNMRVGYKPHNGEVRNVFKMPELEYKTVIDRKTKEPVQKVDVNSMKNKFNNVISQSGGVLELPFRLNFPTGDGIPPLNDDKTDVIYDKKEWERRGYVRKDGTHVKATTVHRHDDVNTVKQSLSETYGLPVMSSYLRSGQEFEDGTSTVHDYTNHYLRIYECAINYKAATNDEDRAKYKNQAQADFDKITEDLKSRKFSGKHNIFREGVMANRLPNSATAVWSADPRLDIDQIAMNPEMAKSLGVKENEYVLTWRDPVLRDAGVRYIRVKIDDSLVGVSINPAMDKAYDGDFDGDSIGLLKLHSKAARKEAMEKLTVNANLLDYGIKHADGTYDVMMQDSLDMKSAEYENPELAARKKELTANINNFELKSNSKKILNKCRANAVKDLSKYTHSVFSKEFGSDMISFGDMKSHMKSVEHMVVNGAKGSYAKLTDYGKYLGVSFKRVPESVDPNMPIDLDSIVDHGRPLATRQDDLDVEVATGVKSFGTGVAGMYSQRAISVLRNKCPKAALELTYPNTQAILQSKHDPIEAKHKYEMLQGTCRDLWRGVKLDKFIDKETGETHWKAVRNDKGYTVQATPEEFKQQFMDIYTSKEGLNCDVNEDFVDAIRDNLVKLDPKTGKEVMMNIEKEAKDLYAAPMDKLAYGGDFDTLCAEAKAGSDLFEGKYNQFFAPSSIRKNKAALEAGEEVKAITKSDTKAKVKSSDKVKVSVSATRYIPEVEDAKTDNTGDFGDK